MHPSATTHDQHQDVVNLLLAAALQARATLEEVHRALRLVPAGQPQAAADLTDTARALTRVHDILLRTADLGPAGEGPGEEPR